MKTVDETQNPSSTDAAVPDPERDLLPAATVFNLNIRRQALDWAVKLGAEAEHPSQMTDRADRFYNYLMLGGDAEREAMRRLPPLPKRETQAASNASFNMADIEVRMGDGKQIEDILAHDAPESGTLQSGKLGEPIKVEVVDNADLPNPDGQVLPEDEDTQERSMSTTSWSRPGRLTLYK